MEKYTMILEGNKITVQDADYIDDFHFIMKENKR